MTKNIEVSESGWPTKPKDEHRKQAQATPPPPRQAREHRCTEVTLQRGSDIKPEPIRWLWPGWLAKGKLCILAGDSGIGKTTVSLALAATLTTGGRWPDGTHSAKGRVVMWSGEDDTTDTLVPRMIAMGADMSRVAFVTGANEGDKRRTFDPAKDVPALQDAITKAGGAQLLIIDPVVSTVAGDGNRANDVRRGLQPLADLAAANSCVVLGITHFSKGSAGKNPVDRVLGSQAFGAAARMVLVAAKQQGETQQGGGDCVLCRAKSNNSPDHSGYAYSLIQTPLKEHPDIEASCVLWGGKIEGSAREILALAEAQPVDGEGGKLAEAKKWLSDFLAGGGVSAKEIEAAAKAENLSWKTVRRAKDELGVKSQKMSFAYGWHWVLPNTETDDTNERKHEDAQKSTKLPTKNDGQHGEDLGIFAECPDTENPGKNPEITQHHTGITKKCETEI